MSWLQQGIQAIVDLTREAKIIGVSEQNPRYLKVLANGELDFVTKPVPPRNHQVTTMASFIGAFTDLARVENARVWHDETAIIGVLCDHDIEDDRLDKVTLPLTFTEDFKSLLLLAKQTARVNQEAFIRLLRYTFGLDPSTVNKFRRLDWAGSSSASDAVVQGSSKMGKSITAEVLGIDDLPEEIMIWTSMFEQDLDIAKVGVLSYVDIDPHQNALALVPDQDSLRMARIEMSDRIQAALVEGLGEGARVYHGRP